MPYLIKNSAGNWCVQKKVPEKLQAAVARVLGGKEQAQVYLKKSLGTKDRREATRRATHALADLDRTLREAEALSKQQPPKRKAQPRATVNDAEIKRMGEYVYAKALAWDERTRYGRDEFKRMEAEHERLEGPLSAPWAVPHESLRPHGWSPAQLAEQRQQLSEDLSAMQEHLAMGDVSAVQDQLDDALDAFNIDLDRQRPAYPKLGMEVLRAYVRALKAIEQRNAGEPVPTPQLSSPSSPSASGTLSEALEGWKKVRERPEGTVHEYGRAIEMFAQLHGNLSIPDIKRSHVRTFRDALQLIPKARKGSLLKASLPELSDYGRAHPTVTKV